MQETARRAYHIPKDFSMMTHRPASRTQCKRQHSYHIPCSHTIMTTTTMVLTTAMVIAKAMVVTLQPYP